MKGMRIGLLVSTILVMSIVIAAGVMGYKYYSEQYQELLNEIQRILSQIIKIFLGQFGQDVKHFLAFVVIAAGLIVIISLIAQCCQPKLRKIMLILITMLLLALSVVLAMKTSHTSNFRLSLKEIMTVTFRLDFELYEERTNLRDCYGLLIAATVLTFLLFILWIFHHIKQSDFLLSDVIRHPFAILVYIFTILFSGLIFASNLQYYQAAQRGYQFFHQFKLQFNTNALYPNLSKEDYLNFMIFIIIAAALAAIFSFIQMIMAFNNTSCARIKQFLLILGVAVLLALAISLAIKTTETYSLRRQLLKNDLGLAYKQQQKDLNIFYKLLIASTVITFMVMLLWLLLIIQANYKFIGANIQQAQPGTIENPQNMNNIVPASEIKIMVD